jgi:hypothetical protein
MYLRIGAIGLPFALIALAGQGYLRGVWDLRTPLVIVAVANVANVVLEVVFVYVFGWGLLDAARVRADRARVARARLGNRGYLVWAARVDRGETRNLRRAVFQPAVGGCGGGGIVAGCQHYRRLRISLSRS